MTTALYYNGQRIINPTKKSISSILRRSPVVYEITLYLLKSRIKPFILRITESTGSYQTYNGAILILKYNQIYLTLTSQITSLKDITKLETIFENSKYEVLWQYPTYQGNIKKSAAFHKMLGKAWKKK